MSGLDKKLALPYEYVADENNAYATPIRDVSDLDQAAQLFIEYLGRRIDALCKSSSGTASLMLSGGIDSILAGAIAKSIGVSLPAITVVAADKHSSDLDKSKSAAEFLGLEHTVVSLGGYNLLSQVEECIDLLSCDELWEVMSAVPIRAAFSELSAQGITGPVLTGTGADAILGGGQTLATNDKRSQSAEMELNELIQGNVASHFRRERLIPDYYERILGSRHADFIMLFQTEEAWRIANRMSPAVLWRSKDGQHFDKACLRRAAELLRVPIDLAWTKKAPLQRSSGLIDAVVAAARLAMSKYEGATTYTDPRHEEPDLLIARLALRFHTELVANLVDGDI